MCCAAQAIATQLMGVSLGGDDETTYALEAGGYGLGSSGSGSGGGLSAGGLSAGGLSGLGSAGSGLGAALQQESSRLGKSQPSVDELASSFASLDAFTQSAEGGDAVASSEGSSGAPGSLDEMLRAEQEAIAAAAADGGAAGGGGGGAAADAVEMPRHEGHRDELCQYHMAGAWARSHLVACGPD
jgi:hypothetical protein